MQLIQQLFRNADGAREFVQSRRVLPDQGGDVFFQSVKAAFIHQPFAVDA